MVGEKIVFQNVCRLFCIVDNVNNSESKNKK